MDAHEAANLLAVRRELTGEQYSRSTALAWAEALEDLSLADAHAAVVAVAADPAYRDVAVPQIRQWLRDRARRAKLDAHDGGRSAPTPADFGCRCTTFTLCDLHRDAGLTGIAAIRAQRAGDPRWRSPADREPDFRYAPIQEDS